MKCCRELMMLISISCCIKFVQGKVTGKVSKCKKSDFCVKIYLHTPFIKNHEIIKYRREIHLHEKIRLTLQKVVKKIEDDRITPTVHYSIEDYFVKVPEFKEDAKSEADDSGVQNMYIGSVHTFVTAESAITSHRSVSPVMTFCHLEPGLRDNMIPVSKHTSLIFGQSTKNFANSTLAILHSFSWRKIAVISEYHLYDYFDMSYHAITFEMHKQQTYFNISLSLVATTNGTCDLKEVEKILNKTKKTHRIILLSVSMPLARCILKATTHWSKFPAGTFVFVMIEKFTTQREIEQPWYDDSFNETHNEHLRLAFESVLRLSYRLPEGPDFDQFVDEIKGSINTYVPNTTTNAQTGNSPNSPSDYDMSSSVEIQSYLAYFHDALMLYARALNHSLSQNKNLSSVTPYDITRYLKSKSFEGLTGNLTFSEYGDLIGDYSLYSYNIYSEKFEVVGFYDGFKKKFTLHKQIIWPGKQNGSTPDDQPLESTETSEDKDTIYQQTFVALIVVYAIIIVLLSSFFAYKHHVFESDMNRMHWLIKWQDIFKGPAKDSAQDVNKFLPKVQSSQLNPGASLQASLVIRELSIGKRSEGRDSRDPSTSSRVFPNPVERQQYTETTMFKNSIVAIKRLHKTSFVLNKALLLEVKIVRDMANEHICRFVGACIDVPYQCLLYEYCEKGSLQDLLENDKISLDWIFRYSLIKDIARGMEYLHGTEVRSHGNLKSSNCLVDSRFVVKISNFGLHSLRDSVDDLDLTAYADSKRKQWTAPELLRLTKIPSEGTQKGDVYSFGIICQEIVYRRGVFYVEYQHYSPPEVIELVKEELEIPFRPTIHRADVRDAELVRIIKNVWKEDPDERPEFRSLRFDLRRITKDGGAGGNILDNLLRRMEVYANNLEALVDVRTSQVEEQKKKTEALLYNMLPRKVAEQLIQGMAVTAEAFDSVSIYFSDICGFTDLSAGSSPMEVVNLLNALYSMFDGIIENYDIYKVETIGDAYMVVSGLPQPNGDLHAREIARMSLAFVDAIAEFTIPHRPQEKLKLRIGIHSGPVCTGVVGHKMPRYCLFGDTVNTASRMETTGKPKRIHISQETKALLDKFGTFYCESRGEIEVKGKGIMQTYWLLGEATDLELGYDHEKKQLTYLDKMKQFVGNSESTKDLTSPMSVCPSSQLNNRETRFDFEEDPDITSPNISTEHMF